MNEVNVITGAERMFQCSSDSCFWLVLHFHASLKFDNFVFLAGFEERVCEWTLSESFQLLILRESQTACNQLVCFCCTLNEQVYLQPPIPHMSPNQIWRAVENIWQQLQHGGMLLLTDVDGFQCRFALKNNRRCNDRGFKGLKWKS